ncbi:MAG: hypothetical protein K8F91_02915 [Candidatus Obscuribacterales bacterium]|nr:hypothetical protein [Candidatus Obscuribacterales bacterium]
MSPKVDKYVNECQEYWWLFPLVGLSIDDTHDDFSSPCFGDATILSKKWAADTFSKMSHVGSPDQSPAASALKNENIDCLIAVKWEVSEIGNGPWSQSEDTKPAEDRANEMGADPLERRKRSSKLTVLEIRYRSKGISGTMDGANSLISTEGDPFETRIQQNGRY